MQTYSFKQNSIKEFLKHIFKNHIFISFSFINMFIPLYSTIIASLNQPNGTIDVIGIGLISSFSVVFNQLLFLLATSLNFISLNSQSIFDNKYRINISTKYFLLLMFGLLALILFIPLSALYTHFSGYVNITTSTNYGIKYSAILSISLIFNVYIYYTIIKEWQFNKIYSYIFLMLFLILNIILIPLLGVLPKWNNNDSWIGLSISQLIASFTCLLTIICWLILKEKIKFTKVDFHSIKSFFKYSSNFIVGFLLTTLLKTILIIIICFSLGISQKDTPIGVMVAKIIWYNSLYFCGFFADGAIYALEYTRINFINDRQWQYINRQKIFTFCGIVIIATFIINIIFNSALPALTEQYAKNQITPIESPLGPLEGIWNNLYPGVVNSNEIMAYLWSPTNGVYNFQMYDKATNTFSKSYSISLFYVTAYHMFINGSKSLSVKPIKLNQKFDWKNLIKSIIMTSIVIAIIVIIAVAPKNNKGFIKTFPGIDSFSFATMIVAFVLFLIPILGYVIPRKQKPKTPSKPNEATLIKSYVKI